MFTHYRTQGFVFKKEERGEADRIFTIYTKDFGKLELLAKAERKITSKLRGGLELFYLSEVEFIQGKIHKTLTDVILIENFENIKKDLARLSTASQISEALDNLVKGQEPDEKIWNLLTGTFQNLNNPRLSTTGCQLLYYYFFWNLLSISGYEPELYNCSLCQKKIIQEKISFSPKEDGVICSECFKKTNSGQEIEPEIIKILRIILKNDWQTLSKLKIDNKYKKSLKLISEGYLQEILGETK